MRMDKKKFLGILLFVIGAMGMVLELVGSRILSPYYGNTIYVWTSLIGVILGAMSLGYLWGGEIADRESDLDGMISRLLLISGLLVGLTGLFKELVLQFISTSFTSSNFGLLVSSVLLFGPTSFLLGSISPICANLTILNTKEKGSALGSLYAFSTVGSICGTFLAGFILIPLFGNTLLLFLLAMILIVLSAVIGKFENRIDLIVGVLVIGVAWVYGRENKFFSIGIIDDIDSRYSRIQVKESIQYFPQLVRYIVMDNHGWQSAIFPNEPNNLVFEYTKAYRLSDELKPARRNALMIGGAGMTFPRDFVRNEGKKIDVVEIDPKMIELAKKYFLFKEDPAISVIEDDARKYVKYSNNIYDVVLLDAFVGISPPPHLTTFEFISQLKNKLSDDGVMMVNLVGSFTGVRSEFVLAEIKTIREIFPYVDIYKLSPKRNDTDLQNIFVVAYKDDEARPDKILDADLSKLFSTKVTVDTGKSKVLTDDHNPVEFLTRNL